MACELYQPSLGRLSEAPLHQLCFQRELEPVQKKFVKLLHPALSDSQPAGWPAAWTARLGHPTRWSAKWLPGRPASQPAGLLAGWVAGRPASQPAGLLPGQPASPPSSLPASPPQGVCNGCQSLPSQEEVGNNRRLPPAKEGVGNGCQPPPSQDGGLQRLPTPSFEGVGWQPLQTPSVASFAGGG